MASDKKYIPYRDLQDKKQSEILKEKIKELPAFLKGFFLYLHSDVEATVSTRLAYALDLKIFFEFVKGYLTEYDELNLRDLPVTCLEKLKQSDIRYFIREYLSSYENSDGIVRENQKLSQARKLAVIKKMYRFYLNSDDPEIRIQNDPVSLIVLNKGKEENKPIKYLEYDQVAQLLDNIENPESVEGSPRAEKWNQKTAVRDLAIVTLLLGTGLRVSECVGINLQDINFDDGSILVRRKGNHVDKVYMSKEVDAALRNYIENDRPKYKPVAEDENALFLSRAHKRITVRSVERMVTKHTQVITGNSDYTPHKLRSTFATLLLAGDDGRGNNKASLAEVQSALNHKSPSTTSRFYAKVRETERRKTFENFTMRESKE